MSHGDIARRQFLRTSASAISAVWLTAALGEMAAVSALSCAPERGAAKWKSFSDADAADVEAIASLIIPSDGTPGAREAHVIDFIDRALDSFAKEQAPLFASGLADLRKRAGATSFASLDASRQTALLHELEQSKSDFFTAMLAATAAGMFANPEYGGNRDKIGWTMIGFEDRFYWQPPFGYYDRDEANHA
ncbi:MAG: gluconate 2-dehydrogenase subunit 3 family protein [Gemmatimonadota bacterium]